MSSIQIRQQPDPLYKNPVYTHSFPDPFVLKYDGAYYAYCTGQWDDGVFGILRSTDLVHWQAVGSAMPELDPPQPFYWAPEVTYWNGTFYLYYSTGNETFMQLRVATSDRPDGGFRDAGVRLTEQDFAIDAHVFTDDDGQRYLFYATDFLDHSHIGTGVVVDRMIDWFTLAGDPRPVVRAKYDWQVYDPARKEKGGVRWHTVEGPFVLKHKGRYFMMFSGGNWQQPTYGVSFAVSGDLDSQNEWRQFSDGEKVLPILRTNENRQVGPGHNSVVRGPDNRELYCVYHYWHEGNRVLAANRMGFAGPRIFIENKPYLAKTEPLRPSSAFVLTGSAWEAAGRWEITDGVARASGTGEAVLRSADLPSRFLCELSLCFRSLAEGAGAGFRLEAGGRTLGGLVLCMHERRPCYEWIEAETGRSAGPMLLGQDFDLEAVHLICIEVDGRGAAVKLDETYLSISHMLDEQPDRLALTADGSDAVFSGLELTEGFEERFDRDWRPEAGWVCNSEDATLTIQEQELIFVNPEDREAVICKGDLAENFDFIVNLRQKGPPEHGGAYGFVLMGEGHEELAHFAFRESEGRFFLADKSGERPAELPFDFNPRVLYQFRFRLRSGTLYYDLETVPLGSVTVPAKKAQMGIFGCRASVALEMVRLTVINN